VVLATEHFAVDDRTPATAKLINEVTAATIGAEPTLLYAASLECWHSKKITDADWVAECKKDVDRWIGLGAIGFKDHIGKPFDHTGKATGDIVRWLGAWNRFNGLCSVGAASNENQLCMEQAVDTLRYPAMESKWREVLQYIVETKRMPVFTHASDWSGPEKCYDPYLSKAVDLCYNVTRAHLLELAKWAQSTLSVEARRRIVVAHFGFLPTQQLLQLLQAGLSADTAARLDGIAPGGAERRDLVTTYAEQILFGTDYTVAGDCVKDGSYDAWRHSLAGAADEKKVFTAGCVGTVEVTALGLSAEVQRRVQRDNFLRLVGRSCP
jgi:hypothetical protein